MAGTMESEGRPPPSFASTSALGLRLRIIPAATVSLLRRSMRMKLPVCLDLS